MEIQILLLTLRKTNNMKIGQAINILRRKRRDTQKEYAQRIGITQTYLSLIESGKRIPNMSVIQKIADLHEISLPLLFWFSVEESDCKPDKLEHFRLLKPLIDRLIESII